MGISLKRFDGWEPTTTYVTDKRGRLISSQPEQEWDEQQQSWMLALAEQEALSCGGCGGWLPETTAIENDNRYATEPVRCHSCTAQAIAQEQHGKDARHAHAVQWRVPKLKPRRG